jgi:hypothetical protein
VIFTLRRMLIVYHIKKNEKKTACSMHVIEVNSKRVLVVNPEEFGPVRRRSRK